MSSMSIEQIIKAAPGAGMREPHPWMSSRFSHVATIDLVECLMNEGYEVARAQQSSSANLYGFHAITLRMPGRDLVVGDAVPELILTNAADGSRAFRISLGMYRLVCCNGLVVGSTFASYDIDHKQDAPVRALIAAEKAGAQLDTLSAWAERMSNIQTTSEWRLNYAMRAAALRWAGPNGTVEPVGVEDATRILDARRVDDADGSVWHTYNRVQENLIRGGTVSTVGRTGRRTLSKALSSTAKEYELNTRLFDLTNRLAEAA